MISFFFLKKKRRKETNVSSYGLHEETQNILTKTNFRQNIRYKWANEHFPRTKFHNPPSLTIYIPFGHNHLFYHGQYELPKKNQIVCHIFIWMFVTERKKTHIHREKPQQTQDTLCECQLCDYSVFVSFRFWNEPRSKLHQKKEVFWTKTKRLITKRKLPEKEGESVFLR